MDPFKAYLDPFFIDFYAGVKLSNLLYILLVEKKSCAFYSTIHFVRKFKQTSKPKTSLFSKVLKVLKILVVNTVTKVSVPGLFVKSEI